MRRVSSEFCACSCSLTTLLSHAENHRLLAIWSAILERTVIEDSGIHDMSAYCMDKTVGKKGRHRRLPGYQCSNGGKLESSAFLCRAFTGNNHKKTCQHKVNLNKGGERQKKEKIRKRMKYRKHPIKKKATQAKIYGLLLCGDQ